MALLRKPKVGDYVIFSCDIGNSDYREGEAYRLIELNYNACILDHNNLHDDRIVDLECTPDYLAGKYCFRFCKSDIIAIVGPSCPYARKAVAFWNECNRK